MSFLKWFFNRHRTKIVQQVSNDIASDFDNLDYNPLNVSIKYNDITEKVEVIDLKTLKVKNEYSLDPGGNIVK